MSLFLGKIHYWLYAKITLFEELEREIINWAERKGMPVEEWVSEITSLYGEPANNQPLEEVIDTSNIHGWLQEKISSAELRQASLITRITQINPDYIKELAEIFEAQGRKTAEEYNGGDSLSPEDIYTAMNEYILEGMPCDRSELLLSNTHDEYAWKLTRCLHRQYWDTIKGDVENFYKLRSAWIKAFVETLNSRLSYERSPENIHRIYTRE